MRFADWDKPHRCPECWTIPDVIWEKHQHARRFWPYRCRNGHRFVWVPTPWAWWRSRKIRAAIAADTPAPAGSPETGEAP